MATILPTDSDGRSILYSTRDNNADLDRGLLMNSGECRFSTFGQDVSFTGSRDRGPKIYEPGITSPGQHGSTSAGGQIGLIPAACERLLTERKVGDPVYIDMIQRGARDDDWQIIGAYYYILGERINTGFSQWQLNLLSPINMLGKGETIQWSNEYFERKGWGDWFKNLSNVKEKIFTIVID